MRRSSRWITNRLIRKHHDPRTYRPGAVEIDRVRLPERYGSNVIVPTTLVPPGPGRFAFEFTVGFVVAATQNADPNLIAFATPTGNTPAGVPGSRISSTCVPARRQVPPVPQVVPEQPWPSAVPPTQ